MTILSRDLRSQCDPADSQPEVGPVTLPVANEGLPPAAEAGRRSALPFRPFGSDALTPTAVGPLDDTFLNFLRDVFGEIERAIEKFPQPNASMCALTEEVGELAKAMMDEPRTRVWREAVQVAAMAARVAVEGDPTLDATRAARNADGGGR